MGPKSEKLTKANFSPRKRHRRTSLSVIKPSLWATSCICSLARTFDYNHGAMGLQTASVFSTNRMASPVLQQSQRFASASEFFPPETRRTWTQRKSPRDTGNEPNHSSKQKTASTYISSNSRSHTERSKTPPTSSASTATTPAPRRRRRSPSLKLLPVEGYNALAIEEYYDRRPLQVGWRLNSIGFPLLGKFILVRLVKRSSSHVAKRVVLSVALRASNGYRCRAQRSAPAGCRS